MANLTSISGGDAAIEHATWTKAGPVVSRMPEDEIVGLEEHAMATIGDSTTLGLWAFATGTWILGAVIGGSYPYASIDGTIPVLLIFAGIAQFVAGLYAFRRTNSLAATAFCCFGSLNVTLAMLFLLESSHVIAATASTLVFQGFLLESFFFIAAALCLAALRTNMALVAVLATLAIGFACAGVPDLTNSIGRAGWGTIGSIGGYFLMASAFFAYYSGMAMIVNSAWNQEFLPLFGRP
ncbi:MAG TPA: acetate uptake transporter [Candidatus Binataceae bacterium]|nr:acetate uptake transporter [Candidatus Binataceae bacterium]